MTVDRKLRYVYEKAPESLKPRLARVILAIDRVTPEGVGSPLTRKTKPVETTLTMLQDHADSFLSLMRTLPKDHEFKKLIGELSSLSESIITKMDEAATELADILETDEEDLPGIQASALGELAQMLEGESGKLADLKELTSTLNTLAGKVHKEKKTEPVEHDMQGKDITPDKKDKDEGDDKSDDEEDADESGDKAMQELNEMFST